MNASKRIWPMIVAALLLLPLMAEAGLRGLPEGKPRVEVGTAAPLDLEGLKKAHEEGKVILLMFGNPTHCIYCEKVWTSVELLKSKHEEDVAAVLAIHRAAKFWGGESDAVALGKRYGVIGEPWLYLIDREGIVRHIFVGMVGRSEIEAELEKVLDSNPPQP